MNPEALIESSRRNWLFILRAWLVHLYTSLGLICAFFAFGAILNHNARAAFIALAVAMVIDATDGTLARAWKVKVWAPTFDGRKLDDITDYLTYAFIPLFFAWQFQLVSRPGVIVLFICIITAAYGFCNESAKTRDGYFTGFPNFWDLVIFYLFLMKTPSIVNEIVLLVCSFNLHPSRVYQLFHPAFPPPDRGTQRGLRGDVLDPDCHHAASQSNPVVWIAAGSNVLCSHFILFAFQGAPVGGLTSTGGENE
jgi:phosphatidylserine synthase